MTESSHDTLGIESQNFPEDRSARSPNGSLSLRSRLRGGPLRGRAMRLDDQHEHPARRGLGAGQEHPTDAAPASFSPRDRHGRVPTQPRRDHARVACLVEVENVVHASLLIPVSARNNGVRVGPTSDIRVLCGSTPAGEFMPLAAWLRGVRATRD